MMLRALTAVGLSTVVVASTVASIEGVDASNSRKPSTALVEKDRSNVALPTAETAGKPSLLADPVIAARLSALRGGVPNLSRSAIERPVAVVPKTPTFELSIPMNPKTGKDIATGRIKFKFQDDIKARTALVANDRLMSLTGADVRGVEGIIAKYGGTVRQLLSKSPTSLKALEDKAFAMSNRRQTDLASMMLVEFPAKDLPSLLAAAQELNEVNSIQWVRIEMEVLREQEDVAGCGNPDNPDQCNVPSMVEGRDGPLGMAGFTCWDPTIDPGTGLFVNPGIVAPLPPDQRACNPDPECELDPSPCIYGCVDGACCDQVSAILPYCNDEDSGFGWDAFCAALANVVCNGTKYDQSNPTIPPENRFDPCLTNYVWNTPITDLPPISAGNEQMLEANVVFEFVRGSVLGPCTEAHPMAGCSQPACCVRICLADPTCCTLEWDDMCANVALTPDYQDDCGGEPVGGTRSPKLEAEFNEDLQIVTGLQAYMRPQFATNFQFPPAGPGFGAEATIPANPCPPPPESCEYFVHDWQWQTTTGDFDPTDPPEGTIDSSFLYSWFTGGGFDVPGMERLTGELWANYGGGTRPGRATLPTPTKVWLYGGEFELVSANAGCRGVDGVQYICDDCYTLDEMTARFPDFAAGATTANPNTGLNDDYRLCPTGRKVGGAVIEFAAYKNHEEFVCEEQSADGTCTTQFDMPRVIAEEGQTMILNPMNNPDHGTACLGVMVSGDNGFGVRGLGSEGQGYFFPTVSTQEGARLDSALVSALQTLPAGSCINMSIGFGGGNVITTDEAVFTLVAIANDLNLVVAISAGNDCAELNPEAGEEGSGAMIVGACGPGIPLPNGPYAPLTTGFPRPCSIYPRLPFSNWSADGLVPICAWGNAVASTGYGTVYRGENDPTSIGEEYETNQLRTYCGPTALSDLFNGTSAASPQIAGLSMWMQGFAQTFYSQFLPSSVIAGVLSGGTPYCGHPGDRPGNQFGPCAGDSDPEEEGYPIGNFPNASAAALGILTNLDSSFDGSLDIFTGTHLQGNRFSLGTSPPNYLGDGNTLRLRTELAIQGPGPAGLTYFGSGPTIDFGVIFKTHVLSSNIDSARLRTICSAPAQVVVQIPFIRNQELDRYVAIGANVMTATLDMTDFDLGQLGVPSQYFTEAGDIDVRIYALGLGYLGQPSTTAAWDVVWPIINDPLGGNDP